MWENPSSGRPSARTAAAESPPPTTLNPAVPSPLPAVVSTMAWATPRVPSANGASSNTPIGPFQNTVFALASTCANAATDSGPMSRPFQPSGIFSTGTVRVLASAEKSSATTTSTGSTTLPDSSSRRQLSIWSSSSSESPTPQPLGGEEGEAHPAADQQRVDLRQQRLDHLQLVGDLRPAEHDGVGPLRVVGQLAQHLDLGEHQPARVGGQLAGQVVDRGLLAVHDPEPVGDEDALASRSARRAHRPARPARRRPCWSPAGRSGCSPAARRRRRSAGRPPPSPRRRAATSATSVPSSSPEAGRDRAEGVLAVVRTGLGPAEVRGDDDPRTARRAASAGSAPRRGCARRR